MKNYRSPKMTDSAPLPQIEKFKQAARDLECDEDEARWDDRLKKVAKQKPAPEKPE
jgi:hypothetical protein